MVAIISGNGLGIARSSAFVLGSGGQAGSSALGRDGEDVYVDAANGNLVVSRQDEFLIGLGPDISVDRTYNSQATSDADNGDNWRMGVYRRLSNLPGTYGATGSTVTRTDWDGSVSVYTWNASFSAYVTTDGAGAYDTLTQSGSVWTWTDGDSQARDLYDSAGLLTASKDTDDNTLTYDYYSGTSIVSQVTDQDGGKVKYVYGTGSASTQLQRIETYVAGASTPSLTRVKYTYSSNRLSSVTVDLSPSDNSTTDSNVYVTNYGYDSSNRVVSITQTDGSELDITYDGSGRVASTTETVASGVTRTTSYDYSVSGRTTVTDPAGQKTVLFYDSAQQLIQIVYPAESSSSAPRVVQFVYTINGDVKSVIHGPGDVTDYDYDSHGNRKFERDSAGNVVERTYGSKNELQIETHYLVPDPDGAGSGTPSSPVTTRYAYDSEDHLHFAVSAEGMVTEYVYDTSGTLHATIGYAANLYSLSGLGTTSAISDSTLSTWTGTITDKSTTQRTEYGYDGAGNLIRTTSYAKLTTGGAFDTSSDKSETTATYDSYGNVLTRLVSGSTASEVYVYDGLARMTSATDFAGATTTTTFTDASTTTAMVFANGLTKTSVYDKTGALISSADSGSGMTTATTSYHYDNLGRLRNAVDATGRTAYFFYDSVGRKVADIDADGSVTEYRYDSDDDITSTTRYATRLTSTQLASLVDSYGNPTSVTFASLRPSANAADQWTFNVYDHAQRVVQTIDGTGATTTYAYDGASRVTSTTTWANRLSSTQLTALKAEETSPNYWLHADDPTLWNAANLSRTSAGTIDGANAEKFTVITSGVWEGVYTDGFAVGAGDTITATVSIKAVGSGSTDVFGVYTSAVGWGDDWLSHAAILSGPGTITQVAGGVWTLAGLSSSEATRVTVSRVIGTSDNSEAVLYVKDAWTSPTAGDATILAAPVLSRSRSSAYYLPTADSAHDRVSRMFYDADGRVVAAMDAAGGLSQTVYDAAGRKVRDIAFANPVTSSTKATDSLSALLTSAGTNAADRRSDYVYDARGYLRFAIDANAHPAEYVYDAAGRVLHNVDYAGAIASASSYSVAYVEAQLSSTGLSSNTNNRITRTVYDIDGRAAFTIDTAGGVAALTYDSVGNVVKTVRYVTAYSTSSDPSLATMQSWATSHAADSGNRLSRAVYDLSGRAAYTVDAEGHVIEHQYDLAGRATKDIVYADVYTVSDGATKASMATLIGTLPSTAVVTTYAYDADGRLSDATDGVGAVTHYAYDGLGQVTDITAAYGTSDAATVHRTYDLVGRVLTETGAYGATEATTTTWTYDAIGNALTVTDGRGHTATRTFDALGRVLTENVPVDGTSGHDLLTTNQYDAFGDLAMVTGPRTGEYSNTYYDKLGRVILQWDAENYLTQTSYTQFGEVYQVTRYATPVTGARSILTPPTPTTGGGDATTTFAYDKRGILTSVTDAGGFVESYTLDAFGERTQLTNKLGGVTSYGYDMLGRLRYTYVVRTAYLPNGTVEAGGVYEEIDVYDARSNLLNRLQAYGLTDHRETDYQYDKANRLTITSGEFITVTGSDLVSTTSNYPQETRTYDVRGDLIQVVDASGGKTLSWYDKLGRKTTEVSPVGTLSTWTYDANGNLTASRVYGDAVTIPSTPGGTPPSPVSSTNYRETTYAYDWADRQTSTSIGGLSFGVMSGSTYATSSGTLITSVTYDKAGNVVAETDGMGYVVYSYYDLLGRKVAQVDKDGYLTKWTLDTNGNASSETRYATQLTGSFDENTAVSALVTMAGTSAADRTTNFTYDLNGRRLTEVRTGVAASTVSGLSVSTSTVSATITYTYNALGLVASKTEANGDVTNYTYDDQGRLTTVLGATMVDDSGATVRLQTDNYFDGFGNLVRTVQHANVTGATQRITTNSFGTDDRLTSTTDASGFTRNYAYDVAGHVVKESWSVLKADGTTSVTEATGYRYDAAGRMITQYSATWNGTAFVSAAATRIQYDAYGEVTGKGLTASPDDTAVYQEFMDYDAGGRMWRSTAGDGTWKLMFYDQAGNTTLTLSSTGADLHTYSLSSAIGTLTSAGGTTITNAVTDIGVFDHRGQQLSSIEPDRQLSYNGSSFTTATITTSRTYNAFGEVLSETDANGHTTDYSYDTIGKLIQKQSPSVSYTAENGAVSTARPTEYYYYDASGRLVATRDANNNLTTRDLLAGSGHDGSDAVSTAEYHADGGTAHTKYNVFGDATQAIDELGNAEVSTYDAMDRVTSVVHRGPSGGTHLTDTYTYDGLGERTRHYNSELGSSVVEKTDYDVMGRVTSQVDFAGLTTSYAYGWYTALATSGMGTFGGWSKVTTEPGSHYAVEDTDYFGRTIWTDDYGGHVFSYVYDYGGRLTSKSDGVGASQATSYLNTGNIYQLVDAAGSGMNTITSRYAYDANGNRTYEGYAGTVYSFYYGGSTTSATTTLQNATIAYDALNRITSFTDKDASNVTRITVTNDYDLDGNVRHTGYTYPDLAYPTHSAITENHWYRYDSMNRMVTVDGQLSGTAGASGTTIVRGAMGADVSYDVAGHRATQTKDAALTGYANSWVWASGHGPGSGAPTEYPDEGVNGNYQEVPVTYYAGRREDYTYREDGELMTVKFAETGYSDNGDGTVSATTLPAVGAGTLRVQYDRDAMGRLTRYREFDADGTTASQDRNSITYDNDNNELSESLSQRRTESGVNHTYVSNTTNSYTNGLLTSTIGDLWKDGSDSAIPDTSTSYSYGWYDGGSRVSGISYDSDTGSGSNPIYTTTNYLDTFGRLEASDIADGRRRSVSFAYTPQGQILNRKERSAATANPEDQHYFLNGAEYGQITSDAYIDEDSFDETNVIGQHQLPTNPNSGAFRNSNTSGATFGRFGQAGYDYINSDSNGSGTADSSYTVQGGETLQSIAGAVWGDSSLWYLIASANGLSGSETLVAGTTLTLPDRVTSVHNNAGTFNVYDPNSSLGDLSPTSPKPPKKAGKCAVVGAILMVVVAVAVTIVSSGAAIAALAGNVGSIGAGIGSFLGLAGSTSVGLETMVAAGAVGGALGSIASQGVGIATGAQSGFDWKGVAMGAISGAVGGGIAKLGAFGSVGSKFVQGALRGAASSLVSQGIGVATGLQHQFDWAGVAGAAVGGGAGGALSSKLGRFGGNLFGSTAGGLADATARSIITGTDFGDNIVAVLPQIVGETIGNALAYRASGAPANGLVAARASAALTPGASNLVPWGGSVSIGSILGDLWNSFKGLFTTNEVSTAISDATDEGTIIVRALIDNAPAIFSSVEQVISHQVSRLAVRGLSSVILGSQYSRVLDPAISDHDVQRVASAYVRRMSRNLQSVGNLANDLSSTGLANALLEQAGVPTSGPNFNHVTNSISNLTRSTVNFVEHLSNPISAAQYVTDLVQQGQASFNHFMTLSSRAKLDSVLDFEGNGAADLTLLAVTGGGGELAEGGGALDAINAGESAATGPLNTRVALQSVTDRAVADLAADPTLARDLMSPGSYQHLVDGTNLAPASYGKAVERLTARYVQADPELSQILSYQSRPFVSTPDFLGHEGYNLRTLDIATEAGVASHLARPYGAYTDYVTHPGLPSNLVFPR